MSSTSSGSTASSTATTSLSSRSSRVPLAACAGYLQPNAITTNQRTEAASFGTGVPISSSESVGFMAIYGSGGNIGDAQRGVVTFWPKTGLARGGILQSLEASIGFASAFNLLSTIAWLEAVTAITSLRIQGSVANAFKTGSVLTLYKVSPAAAGAGSDFEMSFSGTLSTVQDNLIPAKTKKSAVTVDQLDVELQGDSLGQDVKIEFFSGVTSLGIVTVTAGTLSGTLAIAPTVIPAETRVTCKIRQVGTTQVAITASMFARSA